MLPIQAILRHALTALAVIAMLSLSFRVHIHLPSADGHVTHSETSCGILDLLGSDAEPEPHGEDEHCHCGSTVCAPPMVEAVVLVSQEMVLRRLTEVVVVPEGLVPQPDPPPVRTV